MAESQKLNIRNRMIGGFIPVFEVVLEHKKNERLPLVIYYHGWQINKNLVLTQGRKLAHKGFRVVLPDAANHGERYQEMSPIPSMTFFNSIHSSLFEFEYIIKYFKERDAIDERIGVGGLSMGGMTTCAILTHHSEIMAAACIMGTPKLTAYRDRIKTFVRREKIFLPSDYDSLTAWVPEYDLSLHPETLGDRPMFIWHGRQDEKVPFEPVEEFVLEQPQLNLEIDFEDARHLVNSKTMDNTADFFERIMLQKD